MCVPSIERTLSWMTHLPTLGALIEIIDPTVSFVKRGQVIAGTLNQLKNSRPVEKA